ncbi:hypothetical protein Bca101_064535 [Brassica carinata]
MAAPSHRYFAILALFAVFLKFCYSQNVTIDDNDWGYAGVTWYGEGGGAGSTGGACGYGLAVANPPFFAMVSAGGPSLFNNGKGCGTCYQCPGGPCASEPAHFDLSGKAIEALARHGQVDQLRAAGVLRVVYRRVPCTYRESSYSSSTIALHVDAGANPYYMAFVVEYEDGDGDLASVEIQPAGGSFIPMQQMRSEDIKKIFS